MGRETQVPRGTVLPIPCRYWQLCTLHGWSEKVAASVVSNECGSFSCPDVCWMLLFLLLLLLLLLMMIIMEARKDGSNGEKGQVEGVGNNQSSWRETDMSVERNGKRRTNACPGRCCWRVLRKSQYPLGTRSDEIPPAARSDRNRLQYQHLFRWESCLAIPVHRAYTASSLCLV